MQSPLPLPSGAVTQQALEGYLMMMDSVAFSAKAYWAMWGPLGLPVIDTIDSWAQTQREFLQPPEDESQVS